MIEYACTVLSVYFLLCVLLLLFNRNATLDPVYDIYWFGDERWDFIKLARLI